MICQLRQFFKNVIKETIRPNGVSTTSLRDKANS